MKEPKTPKLKLCPFCEGQNVKTNQIGITAYYFARCLDCGAQGPISEQEEAAVEAWNNAPRRKKGK